MARKRLTDEERAQRRAQDRERAVKAVEELRTIDGWRRWLRVRRSFRTYSLQNQLLIALQAPGATMIAGFSAWKKLGYAVRKGERAIRIWAPHPPSQTAMEQWRKDGAIKEKKPKVRFGAASVFDRAQVDPMHGAEVAPLDPPVAIDLHGDSHAWLLDRLTEFAGSICTDVCFQEVGGGAQGYCVPDEQRIAIDNTRSANSQAATLIHELAHMLARLHHLGADGKITPQAAGLSYAEEELVVESVTYTVGTSAGLDVSAHAIPYMTVWAGRAKLETIEQTAGLIDTIAREIETAIDADADSEPPVMAKVAKKLRAEREVANRSTVAA